MPSQFPTAPELATEAETEVASRLGLGRRYFVYPGRYDVRHDGSTLMAALTQLAHSPRPARSRSPRRCLFG